MQNEIMELEQKSIAIDEQARAIIVKTQEQYDIANNFIVTVKDLQKEIKDTFAPMKKKASDAHKEIVSQETKHLEPLLKAEVFIKSKMMTYLHNQEAIRQEQERKLQVEAEKRRQEALAKAEVAREAGKETKAEKYEDKAAQIVAPILAPTVDKGNAIIKKLWRAEVYDLTALVKAVAEGKVPITVLEANSVILNNMAKTFKDTMSFPGVKFIGEDNLGIRR